LTHYWHLKREQPEEIVRLKAMTATEREHAFYKLNHPPLPKWSYENTAGEAWLIRRQEYLDTHKDIPMFTTWDELDAMILNEDKGNDNGTRRVHDEER
jgi:hypothetical protein